MYDRHDSCWVVVGKSCCFDLVSWHLLVIVLVRIALDWPHIFTTSTTVNMVGDNALTYAVNSEAVI